MECLPEPDIERSAFTEHMRFGWTLAAESFEVEPPAAPEARAAADIQAWSEENFAPWLERKTHTIEAARRELDQAAEESHRQRIMGGAIAGLMYEDVSVVFEAIPVPEELDDEPEVRGIYHDVQRGQARPFIENARAAYRACAINGTRPPTMRHWSRFCAARQERLPPEDPVGGNAPRDDETQVDVVAD